MRAQVLNLYRHYIDILWGGASFVQKGRLSVGVH